MRLLLAEDERELSNALVAIFTHERYSVDAVYNGQDALDYALCTPYDGIVLDIMMPKMDGITTLKTLRSRGVTTPVLMLTAKSQVTDRIEGLDAGADDYLPKPFAVGELLARVRAMTRRSAEYIPDDLSIGNIALCRATFELRCGSEAVRLSNREYQMMEMLILNQGRVTATEHFMQRIWGHDCDAEISVVWVYISHLRRKLAALRANVVITAVRGRGYTLEIAQP